MNWNRKEAEVKAGVHAYLELRKDLFFFRQNVSASVLPSGRFVKSGLSGTGDFLACQAPAGRFVAIEVKREDGGTQSPDQIRFQQNLENHGGLYLLVSSVEEVVHGLGPERAHVAKIVKRRVVPR